MEGMPSDELDAEDEPAELPASPRYQPSQPAWRPPAAKLNPAFSFGPRPAAMLPRHRRPSSDSTASDDASEYSMARTERALERASSDTIGSFLNDDPRASNDTIGCYLDDALDGAEYSSGDHCSDDLSGFSNVASPVKKVWRPAAGANEPHKDAAFKDAAAGKDATRHKALQRSAATLLHESRASWSEA